MSFHSSPNPFSFSVSAQLLLGASGARYHFEIYPRRTTFSAGGGVYVMAKQSPPFAFHPGLTYIYVGETSDLSQRPLNHERKSCFDLHKADSVLILREANRARRLDIETDLRHSLSPPCNRQ